MVLASCHQCFEVKDFIDLVVTLTICLPQEVERALCFL